MPSLTFGTKTSYTPPRRTEPLRSSRLFPSNCRTRLIHVSLIARHGTRNPTPRCIERMAALKTWLRNSLPTPHPIWLDHWDNQLQLYSKDAGQLTVEGERELWSIGRRFAATYASSLCQTPGAYRIRSSNKKRAIDSAHAFVDGYWAYMDSNSHLRLNIPDSETDSDSDSDPGPRSISHDSSSLLSVEDDFSVEVLQDGRDASLRFFDHHPEYSVFTTDHKASMEVDIARGTLCHLFADLASRLGASLGASKPLDVELVRVLGEACAFDIAHERHGTSKFCRVLSAKDAAILEVAERSYRPFFKGHERFRALAAPLVADLVESLTACIDPSSTAPSYAADLRFAHAETLVPLLLLLGIESNGLSTDNPDYRAGLNGMSPFAANLAIELYESEDATGVSYFVSFRLHERYVERIPALGEQGRTGVVRLEHLMEFFGEVLNEGLQAYA